jgi:hypothetical protein
MKTFSSHEKIKPFTTLSSFTKTIPHKAWEFIYFEHILNIYRIFVKNLERMEGYDPRVDINPYTLDFLHKFSNFLYNVSSKKPSYNLEDLTDSTFDTYIEYSNLY